MFDLCPVTASICLASKLQSDRTVTEVAQTQWFVKWGTIPAAVLTCFIMLDSVFSPGGELQYQTLSSSGLNDGLISLGRWKRQSRAGLRWLRKFCMVCTGQRGEPRTSNILPSASSVLSFTPPWCFFVDKTAPGKSLRNSKYRLPWGVWRRINIFGVRLRWFSLPLLPKYRYV